MRRLWSLHPGPIRAKGIGQVLALQVPQVHRLRRLPGGKVLHQGYRCVLQGGLLQVGHPPLSLMYSNVIWNCTVVNSSALVSL